MSLSVPKFFLISTVVLAFCYAANSQDLTRDLNIAAGGTVEIVNKYGRVGVKAIAATQADAEAGTVEIPVQSKLIAISPKGVSEKEIKITNSGGRAVIIVSPSDPKKRIDLNLILPERIKINIETVGGAVDVSGNFASVEATTDTGTITADVPADELKYQFTWTEAKPRYLADFDIAEVKEKSAGRFEIKGRKGEGEKGRKGEQKAETRAAGSVPSSDEAETRPVGSVPTTDEASTETESADSKGPKPKTKDKKPKPKDQKTVSLDFTTARGIILLNVPATEVMSDLRERPLTNAAKAIVRSGDSLLMEAIRRASPKYFGDYARTLPPMSMEPRFSPRTQQRENPNAASKTAVVRVTDMNNRSIAGLEAKDFEVMENGTPREIVSVERSTAPFNLVLLLDVSGSVENYVNFIRKAARNFVDTVGKEDRVSIVIFNEDVKVLSKFTTDKGKLSESLDTFDAGGGTAYYDALAFTVADTLRPLHGERTAIVILTDGDDNRSFLAFDSLTGSIQESGALVYPLYVPSGLIALGATGGDIDPLRKKYMSLTAKSEGEGDKLAKISGGVYYPITEIGQIQRAYEDIVLQLRSAYNITFRSETASPGTGVSPRLKIRSKRDNVFTAVTSVVGSR